MRPKGVRREKGKHLSILHSEENHPAQATQKGPIDRQFSRSVGHPATEDRHGSNREASSLTGHLGRRVGCRRSTHGARSCSLSACQPRRSRRALCLPNEPRSNGDGTVRNIVVKMKEVLPLSRLQTHLISLCAMFRNRIPLLNRRIEPVG